MKTIKEFSSLLVATFGIPPTTATKIARAAKAYFHSADVRFTAGTSDKFAKAYLKKKASLSSVTDYKAMPKIKGAKKPIFGKVDGGPRRKAK